MPALPTSSGTGDPAILEAVKLKTTDDALLAFFRQRTPPAPEPDKLRALAKDLGGDVPEADLAQAGLIAIGPAAVPILRQVANNVDESAAASRARTCLTSIEGAAGAQLVIHAARLLAARNPSGSTKALLDYLPYAENDEVFHEIEAALAVVAVQEGKPDKALLAALADKSALRRGTAAQVLCQVGGPAYYGPVRPLLKDSRPSVRLKVALGLVGSYDGEAIPVLIDLLADLSPKMRVQAEEYLTQLAGEWAVRGPAGNDLLSRQLRRDVWVAWWKQTDGEKLLDEFRLRTTSDEEWEQIQKLIGRLSDTSADVREAASRDLLTHGAKAAPLLRRAIARPENKGAPFATRVLETIEKDGIGPLPQAAPRLLGLRKPEGTVGALLAYLPFSESDAVTSQILDVLVSTGVVGGNADEVLVKALEDRMPIRRATAALALCRGGALKTLPAVRKLLKDTDTEVRFRAAQGLASAGDKDAVPVLIALLADLPADQVWEVEEFLGRIAGEKAPADAVTNDPASRKKALASWTAWWKENGDKVVLTRMDPLARELGFLIVVENWNPAKGRGRVLEVDPAGNIRWEVDNLFWPYDVQLLRGGNILVVEQQNRVTERDRTGKILWDKYYTNVFHCERLRNGHTFLACRNQLMEVDREGRAVFNHFYNTGTIVAARRFRDGSMAFVSYQGQYIRLDRAGKTVKTITLPWGGFSVNGATILPGDRVIVSVSNSNKVLEYDAEGKQVWEATVSVPLTPHRLANGHTLVPSNNNMSITELDRSGRIVKEMKGLPYRPYRVMTR
jgi:HEAT repeat protein